MPSISYNLNIPNPPNAPSADVTLMQANTNAINTIINVDHYTFGTTSPTINIDGLHKQVTLLNEAAPGLSTGSGVLYANLATGQSWPFWQNALGSFQLLGQNSIVANGYLTLPAGLIIQWGVVSAPSGTSSPFNFPIPFPNNFFSISLTMDRSGSASTSYDIFLSGTPSKSQFITNSGTAGSHNVYFIAIGN